MVIIGARGLVVVFVLRSFIIVFFSSFLRRRIILWFIFLVISCAVFWSIIWLMVVIAFSFIIVLMIWEFLIVILFVSSLTVIVSSIITLRLTVWVGFWKFCCSEEFLRFSFLSLRIVARVFLRLVFDLACLLFFFGRVVFALRLRLRSFSILRSFSFFVWRVCWEVVTW